MRKGVGVKGGSVVTGEGGRARGAARVKEAGRCHGDRQCAGSGGPSGS